MSAREAGDAAALGEGGTRWAAAASAGESGAPAPRAAWRFGWEKVWAVPCARPVMIPVPI